jgi:putative ABC transport system substrate-binding protein
MKAKLLRLSCLLLGCWLAAAALAAPPRIAMILWRGETEVERGFRNYLAERKVDAHIEVHDLDRDLARLPEVLNRLRANPPDLVYTWGTSITLGVAGPWNARNPDKYLQGVPILFTMVASPEETGIASPPTEPARRWITGVSHIAPLGAQINAMRSYLPLSKLGIVFNPLEANSRSNVEALRQQARAQNFSLLEAPLPIGQDGQPEATAIPRLVRDLAKRGAQLLYIGPDSFIGIHRDTLTSAGIANGLPCFTATELELRAGEAMFGLVSRYDLVGRLTAAKAMAILLERRSPAEVPIETLERFSYLIRLPVAQRLKLYPPLPLLRYAEIIK